MGTWPFSAHSLVSHHIKIFISLRSKKSYISVFKDPDALSPRPTQSGWWTRHHYESRKEVCVQRIPGTWGQWLNREETYGVCFSIKEVLTEQITWSANYSLTPGNMHLLCLICLITDAYYIVTSVFGGTMTWVDDKLIFSYKHSTSNPLVRSYDSYQVL